MNESIYSPPEADVSAPENGNGEYYVVAPGKFLLLTILTFGIYLVYWFYRHWKSIKLRDQTSIWPIPRGLFYIFFTHSLFSDFDEKLKRDGLDYPWNPMMAATLVVFVTLLSNVTSQLASRGLIPVEYDFISFVLTPILAWLVLPAQRAANVASGDPGGTGNSKLTGANWAWMIIGGLFWIMSLLGVYLILMEPELLVE